MNQLTLHVLVNCCYSYATYKKKKIKYERKEEYLFCESLQTTAAATDVMNFIKHFFEKRDIPLEKFGYVYTDGAPAVAVNRSSWHC